MFNNLNMLFYFMLFMSSMLSISSSSWFFMWIGLEINMISFIPLILNYKNKLSNESSMKYFLIQTLAASMFILLSLFSTMTFFQINNINQYLLTSLIILPLVLKMGAPPFQNWFIMIIQGISWKSAFILMTWQKIAPLFIMFYYTMNSYIIIMIMSMYAMIMGALKGINQTSLKMIMAYSSINQLGWLFLSMTLNKSVFLIYMLSYMIMNLIVVMNMDYNIQTFNQTFLLKNYLSFSISLLSLGGLPPLFGFLPKWIILQHCSYFNLYMLMMVMILTTLITLIYYLQIIFNNIVLLSFKQKWFLLNNYKYFNLMNSVLMNLSISILFWFNLFF